MNWPLILGLLILWTIVPLLILCALRGRHTQLSRTDDLSNQGAEGNGEGFDHGEINTDASA